MVQDQSGAIAPKVLGWFYLHENKELIYKNDPNSIMGIKESDLCDTAWAWDGERATAWSIVVEANALNANKERIQKLIEDWKLTDEDAFNFASFMGITIGEDEDGNKYAELKYLNKRGLKVSDRSFGKTYIDAMSVLAHSLGYRGGKTWNGNFYKLVKRRNTNNN